MLAFSTAILAYGGLFRRSESAYLVAGPFLPRDIIILRYIESLVLASWSLALLGLPLMIAVAYVFDEPWTFYPLFLGLFLLFIPMPGALGMLLAWFVAIVFPKTPRRIILLVAILLAAVAGWWLYSILVSPTSSSDWLQNFYDRVALVQSAVLPHTWVSKGINYAIQGQSAQAAFYLFITLANALFASVVAVTIIAGGFTRAFARAQVSGARSIHRAGKFLRLAADVLFAYLPERQRLLAGKDLKTFLRDPLQWSQMAILIGLLALYVSNVQRLWTDLAEPSLQVLIAFLNLTAVCLILATFTSRFVFPIVSLESQQLWLLGLLPLSRAQMVLGKFLFALTITLAAAVAVMGISVLRLQLPGPLAGAHIIAGMAACVGLCGVSIGMGARMPVLHERNPARIAGGFGGTVSLLLSVALMVVSLVAMGVMSIQATRTGFGDTITASMVAWVVLVVLINVLAAAAALIVGIRHFRRLET
jgi:ABC-2 type transport system permease protein